MPTVLYGHTHNEPGEMGDGCDLAARSVDVENNGESAETRAGGCSQYGSAARLFFRWGIGNNPSRAGYDGRWISSPVATRCFNRLAGGLFRDDAGMAMA